MTRPLTIVHVSSFPFGLRPAFQHSVGVKLSNGLIRNGHLVLNFSDRDVARARSIFGSRRFGRRPANDALITFCNFHRPDVILLGHADVIAPETLARLRGVLPGVRIAQYNVDPLFEPDNIGRLTSKFGVVDASFVTTAGPAMRALRAGGNQVAFMANPMDASIERGRCDLVDALPHDLFYACGNPGRPLRHVCGRDWDMDDFVAMLGARLPGLRLLLGGVGGRPHLTGAAYQSALETAAIGLNISRRPDSYLYSSDRIAQMIGNGQVVMMERATGYGDIFGDDEMVFFTTLDELVDQASRLAADPARRRAIATAGRARYHALFNEQAVAADLLNILLHDADPDRIPGLPNA
ncbi:MAG: glycosyltransferase family 1 protein [Acetobacteraceae bacterium]|nr:glycosyltransferase family 1 protein [Acetobacteraceae bacterium]